MEIFLSNQLNKMKPTTESDVEQPTKNVVTGKDFAKLTIFKCL